VDDLEKKIREHVSPEKIEQCLHSITGILNVWEPNDSEMLSILGNLIIGSITGIATKLPKSHHRAFISASMEKFTIMLYENYENFIDKYEKKQVNQRKRENNRLKKLSKSPCKCASGKPNTDSTSLPCH
jgi:hypothetical protein